MKVSQYIYTACGKDRNGAFSVFSKTKDITDQESNEIREVMMYKTPPGLPYEPTQQEIEDLFPTKFGYFTLSSGRVCLAHVSYIGRVYSDQDGRTGNYIIHGFVFNKTPDFSPYSFIDNKIFKRFLEKKEWHDNPIPDSYPETELPETGEMPSLSDISNFFNEDRKNKLKLLIEAIINSSLENFVCFMDDHKNLKYWLKALSVCIPRSMQNEISICTHFTNSIIPGNISSRIQIRANQPEGGMFNYAQEAARGRFAFDFVRNIIPGTVKPGKYAQSVCAKLFQGVFEAVKYVDNINGIMKEYSVNINEASNLINLGNNELSGFDNAEELIKTVQLADLKGYKTQAIAKNLISAKLPFNLTPEQSLVKYDFIYKYIAEKRIEIVKVIIENPSKLGIAQDSPKSFRNDLYSKAKFIFDNYLNYIKAGGLEKYIEINKDSNNKIYLVFDFLAGLQNIKNSKDEYAAVKKIMEAAFNKKSLKDLDLFIECANSKTGGFGAELLAEIVKEAIADNQSLFSDIRFDFDILKRLRTKTDFAYYYLFTLVKTFSNKEDFLKTYIAYQESDSEFINGFERQKGNEPAVKEFLKKKDMLSFQNQPLSLDRIKKFFDKYYVKGEDTMGLLVKRLNEYLIGIPSEKKLQESFKILDTLVMPKDADKKLALPIHKISLEGIFSVPYQKIFEIREKREWQKIEEVYKTIASEGASSGASGGGGLKQETSELVIITICGKIAEQYGYKAKQDKITSFFDKANEDSEELHKMLGKINSEKNITAFIEYYFESAANIFITGAACDKQLNLNFDGTIIKAFGRIIEKGAPGLIAKKIILGAKKAKPNVILLVLFMFRKHFLKDGKTIDEQFANIAYCYFKELSSGERKKIFEGLLSMAEPDEKQKFDNFFKKFNEENKKKGFFGLFG